MSITQLLVEVNGKNFGMAELLFISSRDVIYPFDPQMGKLRIAFAQ